MQSPIIEKYGRRVAQIREYREWIALVKEQTGKGLATQLREIRALKKSGGHCGVSDYYWYKLYDENYLMGGGARDFLGWRLQQQFSLALNPRNAALPAWDKAVFSVLASSAGLPVAPIRACFHPAKKISSSLGLHLRTREEAGTYLRDSTLYPMFGKPAYSQQGYGSLSFASYDPVTDSLNLLNGKSMSVDDVLKRLAETVDHRFHKPECGFLFQQSFNLAPQIRALTNWPAICGVRVVCLNGPGETRPIRAIWKIAVPPNHVDNFSLGKYGNLLADVDLSTGEIRRVISGFWPKTHELKEHPHTGKSMIGFRLPGWENILEACRNGGRVFPLLKIHHWDFALTDQGPLILELNDIGSTEIAQLHGHGLLTEETRRFLRAHGDLFAHSWIREL